MNSCCPRQPHVGRWRGSHEARELLEVLLWVVGDEGWGEGRGRQVELTQWKMVEVRMGEVRTGEVTMVQVNKVMLKMV